MNLFVYRQMVQSLGFHFDNEKTTQLERNPLIILGTRKYPTGMVLAVEHSGGT